MTVEKEYLLSQIEKIHTTDLGIVRIKRNLNLAVDIDAVTYCKSLLRDSKSVVVRKGKNFYVTTDQCVVTINASKLSIITAHSVKKKQ